MNDRQLRDEQPTNEASLGYMLRLAGPMVITTMSFTAMQFVDRIMVSRLGTAALGAVFPAGAAAFLPGSFTLGITMAVATFVSQHFGRRQNHHCSSYCWQGIYIGLAFFAVVIAVMWPMAHRIFEFMGQPPEVIAMEVIYFRIILLCQVLTVVMWSSSQFFMGIHRPGVVMYSALVSQLVNVIANYVLIFGHFGFPAMGIAGAAWGTVFAEGVGSAVRMAVFLGPRINREFSSRRAMKIDLAKMWDLVKIGFPTGIELMVNVALWGVMLSGFVGGFGKESLAATSAALACTQFSVMPVVGIRSALTAAVGKAIGAGRKDLAVRQTDLCLRIALIYMGLVGLVILIFRGPIMRAWAGDSQAAGSGMASIGARILVLAAIYQIFHAARVIYSGALRGAGDTLWLAMISAGGSVFVLGVGGWVAVEFFPSFGAVGPWAAATLSIVVVGLANMWRFKTNKWMEIDLLRNADAVASAGNLQ